MPSQGTKDRPPPAFARIALRAALLAGLALLLGLSYNAGNPNGIPLSPPRTSAQDHEETTASSLPAIRNETESVTLIRSSNHVR